MFKVFFGKNVKEVDVRTENRPLLPAVTPVQPAAPSHTGPDEWEIKIDVVKECSKCPSAYDLEIEPLVKVKISALMKKYRSLEWLAYLVGENNRVKDLLIPEQTVSGARVDNVHFPNDNPDAKRVIGVIHSHHHMGNFFSGTDDAYINQNHNISLVATHDKITGRVRYKLPCGAFKEIDVNIIDVFNVDFNEDEFIKTADEKIKERVYTPTHVYRGGQDPYDGYYGADWRSRYAATPVKKKDDSGSPGGGNGHDMDEWDGLVSRALSDDDREETLEEALRLHFKKENIQPKPDDPSTKDDDDGNGYIGCLY